MELPVKKLNIDLTVNENEKISTKSQKQRIVQSILTYDVLRLIFKYLGARDLYKVATICRSWRDAANSEASTRRAPECLLKNFQINDEGDSEDSCNVKLLGNNLRIKPCIGLIFQKIQDENEWKPLDCCCENLPLNCSVVTLEGYDIVTDAKIDMPFGMTICAFLPKIPNLNHKIFDIDRYTFKGVSDIDVFAHCETLIKKLLPTRNEKSKCIIMLTNQEGYHFKKFMMYMKGLQKRYKPGTVSLWGGVCFDLKLCESNSRTSSRTCSQTARWLAITLSGPTLQSWSIVLFRSYREESQIQKKLEDFAKQIHLKKHSLGLMFACCERMHLKKMEISVFKRVFPKVPLIGLHGGGEYGLNTLSERRENQLQHTDSTIFLILTYQ